MTFSVVARCEDTGRFGIAAATEMPAVGKLLTHARAGIGAVATQAQLNPYLGIDGVALLEAGLSAAAVLSGLKRTDPRFATRQVAIVDRWGRAAAWTGDECLPWAGAITRDGHSVQGNRLTGPDVVRALDRAMCASVGEPLSLRLVRAMEAADRVGGDRLGERSATVYIVDTEEYPLWDIRVDDHPRPIEELRRLHDVFDEELLPEIRKMPTRANPAGNPAEHQA